VSWTARRCFFIGTSKLIIQFCFFAGNSLQALAIRKSRQLVMQQTCSSLNHIVTKNGKAPRPLASCSRDVILRYGCEEQSCLFRRSLSFQQSPPLHSLGTISHLLDYIKYHDTKEKLVSKSPPRHPWDFWTHHLLFCSLAVVGNP
jgi:hypothetical protein